MALLEILDGRRLGEAAKAADGDNLVGGGVVQDDGRHPSEVRRRRQRDVDRDPGGYAGVYGVAALLQDAKARGRGERVAAGDHVTHTHYRWPVRIDSRCHVYLLAPVL